MQELRWGTSIGAGGRIRTHEGLRHRISPEPDLKSSTRLYLRGGRSRTGSHPFVKNGLIIAYFFRDGGSPLGVLVDVIFHSIVQPALIAVPHIVIGGRKPFDC